MRDTEEGVGVVGETIGDEAEIEVVAFEAVVKPDPSSTSTGCMFGVGRCREPLISLSFSPLGEELDSELGE
jgi:hypothetical protein